MTEQEYARRLSTSQLKALLREECEGRGNLPADTILDICRILSERDPKLPTAKEILLLLCRSYLDN